jgi:hypothetical protein
MATKIPGARSLGTGGAVGGRFSIPSPQALPTAYDPERQAEGYRRRLEEGLGVDVDKELDDRNIIGRSLNLRKNQNFILDIFEVIGRPQQALFAGLEAAAKGDDPLMAMQRGFSGQDYTRFADVLASYGVQEGAGRSIAGFLGDVLLDPVNIALIKTGVPIAKGALTTKKAAAIAKSKTQAAKVVAAANKKGSGVKNLVRSADDINKVVKRGIEARKTIQKALKGKATLKQFQTAQKHLEQYNALDNIIQTTLQGEKYIQKVSALRFATGKVKQGLGATIKYTDSAVGNILKKIDINNGIIFNNDNIKTFKDFANMDPLDPGLRSLFRDYYEIKNTVLSTFDFVKTLPNTVLEKIRKIESQYDLSRTNIELKYEKIQNLIDTTYETLKNTKDEAGNLLFKTKAEFNALVQRAIEFKFRYDPAILGTISVDQVLSNDGYRLSQESFDVINEIAQRVGLGDLTVGSVGEGLIKSTGADGTVTYLLNPDTRVKLAQAIGQNNTVILNTQLKQASFYDKEMLDFLNKILDNKDFNKFITEIAKDMEFFQEALDIFQNNAAIAGFTEKGYVRHVFNPEFEKLSEIPELAKEVNTLLPRSIDDVALKTGNVKAIAERQFKMSAYEANQVMQNFIREKLETVVLSDESRKILQSLQGQEFFVESLTASITDWIQEIPKLVKESALLDEILIKMSVTIDDAGTLNINPNSDVMVLNYTGGTNVPPGYELYNHSKLIQQLEKVNKVVDSPEMAKTIEYLKNLPSGGKAAIDKQVFQMLSQLSTKKTPALIAYIDTFNNFFKRFKLLSPGFQFRNNAGNSTNMWLAGVPVQEIPRYWWRAHKVIKQAPEITQKVAEKGIESLTAQETIVLEYFNRLVNNGFLYSAESIYDVSDEVLRMTRAGGKELKKTDPRRWAEAIINVNNNLNQQADLRYRLGLMMYGDMNPQILEKAGVRTAEDLVRRALFDPKAISPTERQVIKRLIPFYTWAKKNLAWQMKNFVDNPERYNRLQRAIDGSWNLAGIEWSDIEEYKRESFWIPAPFTSDGNKYTAIRANLPVRSLTEFFDNPLRTVIGVSSPLIRVPFELATGTQIFTQRPIQDFPGQRGYNFDFLTRRQEYLLSQTGLDIPLRTAQGFAQAFNTEQDFSLGGFLPSAFSEGSVDRARETRAYDDLAQIRDLYSYYRQEVGDIPTISDIENRNSNTINLKKRIDKLKVR